MAGQPLTRTHKKMLTDRESEVMERLASGETVTALCEDLGMSTQVFYKWRKETPERLARFEEAREIASHGLVDESLRVVDEARKEGQALTAAQSALVREQASSRRWLAGKLNARDYGPDSLRVEHGVDADGWKQVVEHINANLARLAAGDGEKIEEADYELLEGGNEDE